MVWHGTCAMYLPLLWTCDMDPKKIHESVSRWGAVLAGMAHPVRGPVLGRFRHSVSKRGPLESHGARSSGNVPKAEDPPNADQKQTKLGLDSVDLGLGVKQSIGVLYHVSVLLLLFHFPRVWIFSLEFTNAYRTYLPKRK